MFFQWNFTANFGKNNMIDIIKKKLPFNYFGYGPKIFLRCPWSYFRKNISCARAAEKKLFQAQSPWNVLVWNIFDEKEKLTIAKSHKNWKILGVKNSYFCIVVIYWNTLVLYKRSSHYTLKKNPCFRLGTTTRK